MTLNFSESQSLNRNVDTASVTQKYTAMRRECLPAVHSTAVAMVHSMPACRDRRQGVQTAYTQQYML